MTTIAVVSSTTFGGDHQSCFTAGLTASGAAAATIDNQFSAQGNYSQLGTLVRNAANTHPALTVTAGGLVAAKAAETVLGQVQGDPQFVYLSGVLLTGSSPFNSGGANLNVTVENAVRKGLLTGAPYNVDPNLIYLVVNNNAPMSNQEVAGWTNFARFFPNGPNPPTNSNNTSANNHFMHEFSVLASRTPKPKGLVISSDPYFRHWRTAFTIAVANDLPVPVCYPFHDFVEAAGNSNPGNNISLNRPFLSRPSTATPQQIMKTAYYQLGMKAGQFLIAQAKGQPQQNVGVATWNGTDWA